MMAHCFFFFSIAELDFNEAGKICQSIHLMHARCRKHQMQVDSTLADPRCSLHDSKIQPYDL